MKPLLALLAASTFSYSVTAIEVDFDGLGDSSGSLVASGESFELFAFNPVDNTASFLGSGTLGLDGATAASSPFGISQSPNTVNINQDYTGDIVARFFSNGSDSYIGLFNQPVTPATYTLRPTTTSQSFFNAQSTDANGQATSLINSNNPVTSSGGNLIVVNLVPEPTTFALAGLGGLALIARRKRA